MVLGVAVCVGVGMRFCKVPVSGQDLSVTIKLSRWLSPDKWYEFVTGTKFGGEAGFVKIYEPRF